MKTRFVAHSWPKRRFEDWLNHAKRSQRQAKKCLQMTTFGDVRRRASLCPTRPVTPEVAGSSPVAPAKDSLQIGVFLLPVLAQATAGFPTGHALIPHANPDAIRSA